MREALCPQPNKIQNSRQACCAGRSAQIEDVPKRNAWNGAHNAPFRNKRVQRRWTWMCTWRDYCACTTTVGAPLSYLGRSYPADGSTTRRLGDPCAHLRSPASFPTNVVWTMAFSCSYSSTHRSPVTSPAFRRGCGRHFSSSKGACGPIGKRRATFKVMAAADKTVLVPVGNGSEEMEAVIIVDVLRRAGAKVTVASVEPDLTVTCSRGIVIEADACITECANEQYDLIALPGGMPGAERLRDNQELHQLLSAQHSSDRLYGAICAAPAVVLEAKGFLEGRKATSHPAFVDKLSDQSSADDRVVVDGKLITSRGPGTAFEFALMLVEQLYGKEARELVAGPMVMYNHQ